MIQVDPGQNVPPAVSTEELRKRFLVEVKELSDIDLVDLSHIFSPQLGDLLENDKFIECLLKDVTSLCSVTTIQTEKIKKPCDNQSLGKFYLLLFCCEIYLRIPRS